MATATMEPKAKAPSAIDTGELLLVLATEGEMTLADLIGRVGEPAVALAWARGEVELGKTKYVMTGNAATAVETHNGVTLPKPSLIVEGGIEWSGPKKQWHDPLPRVIKSSALPTCQRYQKYQLEVQVNAEKDVWEWLEGDDAGGRPTRYARRDIKRAEAEQLFALYARLTDKGAAALTN
jgi:hypothetical protein